MTPGKTMPSYADLYWPTLEVLRNRGGSASNRELSEHVPRYLELPDDVVDMPRGDGPRTELDCRLSWARTCLKKADAIDNTARGVWTITPAGREVASEEDLLNLMRGHGPDGQGKAKERGRKPAPGPTPPDDSEVAGRTAGRPAQDEPRRLRAPVPARSEGVGLQQGRGDGPVRRRRDRRGRRAARQSHLVPCALPVQAVRGQRAGARQISSCHARRPSTTASLIHRSKRVRASAGSSL